MYLTAVRTGRPETPEGRFRLAGAVCRERFQDAKRRFRNMDNEQNVHSLVCDLAGGMQRMKGNILYIKPGRSVDSLVIQSDNPIDRSAAERLGYDIERETDLSEAMAGVKNGCFVVLSAKYAPTKTDAATGKKRSIREPEARRGWLLRKMEEAGLTVIDCMERGEDHIVFSHDDSSFDRRKSEFINGYHYRIVARVQDRDEFERAVRRGIGRGRSYGCGLTLFKVIKNGEKDE